VLDTWAEFAARRPDGSFGKPEKLKLQARANRERRGGRTDLRVWLPPLGGRVTWTNVLAHACLGFAWEELTEELVIDHRDDRWWDSRLANLAVVPPERNIAKEAARARRGDRPQRGSDRQPRKKITKPRKCKNRPPTCSPIDEPGGGCTCTLDPRHRLGRHADRRKR